MVKPKRSPRRPRRLTQPLQEGEKDHCPLGCGRIRKRFATLRKRQDHLEFAHRGQRTTFKWFCVTCGVCLHAKSIDRHRNQLRDEDGNVPCRLVEIPAGYVVGTPIAEQTPTVLCNPHQSPMVVQEEMGMPGLQQCHAASDAVFPVVATLPGLAARFSHPECAPIRQLMSQPAMTARPSPAGGYAPNLGQQALYDATSFAARGPGDRTQYYGAAAAASACSMGQWTTETPMPLEAPAVPAPPSPVIQSRPVESELGQAEEPADCSGSLEGGLVWPAVPAILAPPTMTTEDPLLAQPATELPTLDLTEEPFRYAYGRDSGMSFFGP